MQTLMVEQLASFLREDKESGAYEMYYIKLATGSTARSWRRP